MDDFEALDYLRTLTVNQLKHWRRLTDQVLREKQPPQINLERVRLIVLEELPHGYERHWPQWKTELYNQERNKLLNLADFERFFHDVINVNQHQNNRQLAQTLVKGF